MKIIITDAFKKNFKEIFINDIFLDVFLKKLKETNFISLDKNILKFKFYVRTVSVRWIIFRNLNNSYIPIIIAKKSDKNIWDNLILDKNIKSILDVKFKKMSDDLDNKNFIKYDI